MSSITERWLLVEELLNQKSSSQEADNLLQARICENELNAVLNTESKLSNVEERNEATLAHLQVIISMFLMGV